MTYRAAIEFLYSLRLFGAKFGLENTRLLAAALGTPQEHLRFIHVAGTNGKGSTCAFLESIYRAAGYRVGLFTSPHLVRFGERIQINRRLISDEETVRLVEDLRDVLAQIQTDSHPTFFEIVTVMALRYFAARRCDVVIWEAGLGGRLDATNIVTPLVSIVTNVQLDHQKWLGRNRRQIAFEKAGIIKPGIPVLTAEDHPDPLAVLRARAAQVDAPFQQVSADTLAREGLDQVALGLAGAHQKLNAALAVAAARAASAAVKIDKDHLAQGLENVYWPGRFQILTRARGQRMVLDGAHNPAAARTLRDTLKAHFPKKPITLVIGVFRDKDWRGICRVLAPISNRIIATQAHSERALAAAELVNFCRTVNPAALLEATRSCQEALARAAEEPLTVVTGSLYLVGEALQSLQSVPGAANELALNEWGSERSQR